MRTPAGKECPYFYGDYFRGRRKEECRLLPGGSPKKSWSASLCSDCPVPDITRANSCEHMAITARVERRLLGLKRIVEVDVFCRKCECNVEDPHVGCGQCHAGIDRFVVLE
ncbi:MAG TPA: hypothetical protein VMN57_06665 [Anaerolineales bacterium]|nr:hypothetical protein [Anaerolineales bacterium]